MQMESELNLDDVAEGHPRAHAELGHLRALLEARESALQRLQATIYFWMPQVPKNDDAIAKRAGDDSFLLVGWNGPATETAEDLGWIRLREISR
jgi:hypothetical protein